MQDHRIHLAAGALLAGLGVAAGAFGAHALRDLVSTDRLAVFETAVRYQLIHALAVVVAAMLWDRDDDPRWRTVSTAFLAGTVLFSGSLYALVLTGTTWLGAVTPFGGVTFIAGWILFARVALSRRRPPRTGA